MQIQQRARTLVFWLGPMAMLVGFALHRMWEVLPWTRTGEYAALVLATSVISLVISFAARVSFASVCAGVSLFALGWFAGWLPMASTLLLSLAALGLGSILVPATHPARLTLSIVAGMAMIAAVVGWLLMFPVHGQLVYLLVLLAVVAARHRAILEMISPVAGDLRRAVADAPGYAAIASLGLAVATTTCWLPTFQFDDIAFHLGLPWQLQTLGYYRLDAAAQVWALAPWSGDVLQAVVQVVGGEEGRGALNALWLLTIASLSWHLGAGLGLPPWLRWLGIALYASHPLTSSLLGTMQAETPATAGLLALALAIQRAPASPDASSLRLIAVFAGFLLALKVSLVLALVPMGLWMLWRWHGQLPWKHVPVAIVLAIAVGGASYAYALYISGNPVLPLFNSIFKSQYFDPRDYKDGHWTSGFGLGIVWHMVFDTGQFLESRDGAAGFVLIGLSGAWLLAVLDRDSRALALVGMACFFLPLTQIQYLRYAHPAIALLIPVMLAGAHAVTGRRLLTAVCVALCLLNIAFYANSKWMFWSGALRLRVTSGADAVLAAYAPERLVNDYLRSHSDADYVALYAEPGSIFAAELAGHGLVTNWYDRQLSHLRPQCDADPTGGKWRELFALTGATHIVVRSSEMKPALRNALEAVDGEKVLQTGPVELWQLPASVRSRAFIDKRNIARRLLAQ